MPRLPEPDDVDIIVDGRESDPESIRDTIEYIKNYKNRPEYAAEREAARAIFDSVRINSKGQGMDDPEALLEHWRKCAADLTKDLQNGHPNGDLYRPPDA